VTLTYSTVSKPRKLDFDEVIKKSTQILKTNTTLDPAQRERLKCIISKLQDAKVDDRIISGGQSVLNVANDPNKLQNLDEWNRARLHFMNPTLTDPNSGSDSVLKSLQWLDNMTIEAVQKINQIIDLQGAATPAGVKRLRDWVAAQLKNNNSIYQCYKKVF